MYCNAEERQEATRVIIRIGAVGGGVMMLCELRARHPFATMCCTSGPEAEQD